MIHDDEPLRLRARPLTIAWLWFVTVAPALLLALPLARATGSLWGAFPRGDAMLLEPGGFEAIETLRTLRPLLSAHAVGVAAAAVPWAVLLLLSHAALLFALTQPGPVRPFQLAAMALERLSQLVTVGLGFLLLRVLLLLGGFVVGELVAKGLSGNAREQLQTAVTVGATVVTALLLALCTMMHDLANAACCKHHRDAWSSCIDGARSLAAAPIALTARYAACKAAGAGLVAGAAALTTAMATTTSAGWGAWLVHGATTLSLTVLRACWARVTLEHVREPLEAAIERSDGDEG